MHKQITLAALLAATFGAHAASDADLAAIRSQIDEIKKTYEQRIATLENKLAQAEARQAAPVAVAQPVAPVTENRARLASTASSFNPEVSLILQGQ